MPDSPTPGAAGSLDIHVERATDATVVHCAGELDLATSPRLEEAVDQATHGKRLVIDCSKLAFIDSTGMRTLLRAVDRLNKASIGWEIVPGDALRRVSKTLGLDAAIGLAKG